MYSLFTSFLVAHTVHIQQSLHRTTKQVVVSLCYGLRGV